MKVKFKENTTGEVYEFDAWDAEGMRRHPEYTEVKEQVAKEEAPKPATKAKS